MSGVASFLNNVIFKRTSTFALATVVGVFFFERTVDLGCQRLFEKLNEGKLWIHIKKNYEE